MGSEFRVNAGLFGLRMEYSLSRQDIHSGLCLTASSYVGVLEALPLQTETGLQKQKLNASVALVLASMYAQCTKLRKRLPCPVSPSSESRNASAKARVSKHSLGRQAGIQAFRLVRGSGRVLPCQNPAAPLR